MKSKLLCRVKEVRARTNCNMEEAERIVIKADLLERTEQAVTFNQLKIVVRDLILELNQR